MNSNSTSAEAQHPLYLALSLYPIVSTLVGHLRYRDLIQLTLASRRTYAVLFTSPSYFEALKRACGCNGYGVLARQSWEWIGEYPSASAEEQAEIEASQGLLHSRCGTNMMNRTDPVILKGRQASDRAVCQVVGRRCEKCGINVCEECRFFPRIISQPFCKPHGNRPIFFHGYSKEVVTAMCASCDEQIEDWVRSTYPDSRHVCDCDLFNRWVCFPCRQEETKEEKEGHRRIVKLLRDHSGSLGSTITKRFGHWASLNVVPPVRDPSKPSHCGLPLIVDLGGGVLVFQLQMRALGASNSSVAMHLVQAAARPRGDKDV